MACFHLESCIARVSLSLSASAWESRDQSENTCELLAPVPACCRCSLKGDSIVIVNVVYHHFMTINGSMYCTPLMALRSESERTVILSSEETHCRGLLLQYLLTPYHQAPTHQGKNALKACYDLSSSISSTTLPEMFPPAFPRQIIVMTAYCFRDMQLSPNAHSSAFSFLFLALSFSDLNLVSYLQFYLKSKFQRYSPVFYT